MKRIKLTIVFILTIIATINAQESRIKYNPEKDDTDIGVFMSMVGFDYHKFELKAPKPSYITVYIDEYLNDKLINQYDHISANKGNTPKAYFDLIFPKLDSTLFTLKIYTLTKSDSIETIQFRIGELGLFKNLIVNKSVSNYSWKLTEFQNNIGLLTAINQKIPLIYFATAVEENINENTVKAFCNVPNILNNRHLIENKGKIEHFFEIGIRLVEKIE
jgi:hypothetical protein